MSIATIRYQTAILGLLGGLFAAQAHTCAGNPPSAGPSGFGGIWLGFFLGLAPGFFYQRVRFGLMLAVLSSFGGFAGGLLGQVLFARLDEMGMASIGYLAGYAAFGAVLGAMTGVAPSDVHAERLCKGSLGGLGGGLVAGALHAWPVAASVPPLLQWAATGLLIVGGSGLTTWSARYWLLCHNPSPRMARAFPLYDRSPLKVGCRFHPAHVCLLDEPHIAPLVARIVPLASGAENRAYQLRPEQTQETTLRIDHVPVTGRCPELERGHLLEVGRLRFEISLTPSAAEPQPAA